MQSRQWTVLAISALLPLSGEAATPNQIFWTKSRQAARSELLAERISSRKKLDYYGGPVLSNVRVFAVMWGRGVNPDTRARIGGMLAATVASDYLDQLSQYSTNRPAVTGQTGTDQVIGRGTYGGTLTIQPANSSVNLEDADVGAELVGQIAAGRLPHPDANTVFMVYFPPGLSITLDGNQSCEAFCGYHHSVASAAVGKVFYSVQPDLGGNCALGCGFADTPFDNLTVVSSHELAEAITDPAVQSNADLGPPLAWASAQGEEIGDLCASKLTTLVSSEGASYQLQQEFDNSTGRCNPGPFRE